MIFVRGAKKTALSHKGVVLPFLGAAVRVF